MQQQVPLKALCDSVANTRTKHHVLNIVFLEGMDAIEDSYLQSLKHSQINLIDYEEEFSKIKIDYRSIFELYSKFESYCFLRWVCLHEITKATSSQIWHIDSDVILHVSLDKIAEDSAGKTFMLEGCPVFTSIAKMEWFYIYKEHLNSLLEDSKEYSKVAFHRKSGNQNSDHVLCNQSLYRNPIGSDQDLLQYLIGSRILPQDEAPNIFGSCLFYIQNPLQLNGWKEYQGEVTEGDFVNLDGAIKVNSRVLAFTHFQGNFVTFCNIFYFLQRLRLPVFVIRKILRFTIKDEKFRMSKMAYLLRVFINRTGLAKSRSELVRIFVSNENSYLIKIMNFLAKR